MASLLHSLLGCFPRDQRARFPNVGFDVSSLLGFLQLKYQGQADSPFQTHPITINVAITSLLICFVTHKVEQRMLKENRPRSPFQLNVARRGKVVFGYLLVASLASLLYT